MLHIAHSNDLIEYSSASNNRTGDKHTKVDWNNRIEPKKCKKTSISTTLTSNFQVQKMKIVK